jgi:hypothetical protein
MTTAITTQVSERRMADLLCNALEGGSNYWYDIKEFIAPPEITFRTWDRTWAQSVGGEEPNAVKIFRHIDYPMSTGGALVIQSLAEGNEPDEINGNTQWRLDLPAMRRGLQLMAEKYPHHWRDFQTGNDDAATGDVFLQLSLFGEVVYG